MRSGVGVCEGYSDGTCRAQYDSIRKGPQGYEFVSIGAILGGDRCKLGGVRPHGHRATTAEEELQTASAQRSSTCSCPSSEARSCLAISFAPSFRFVKFSSPSFQTRLSALLFFSLPSERWCSGAARV